MRNNCYHVWTALVHLLTRFFPPFSGPLGGCHSRLCMLTCCCIFDTSRFHDFSRNFKRKVFEALQSTLKSCHDMEVWTKVLMNSFAFYKCRTLILKFKQILRHSKWITYGASQAINEDKNCCDESQRDVNHKLF